MDLILWRHAEAQPAHDDLADLDRRLTAQGERQARRMGLWLQQHLPATTRVLVSPAARTVATAEALERRYRVESLLAPDADADALLRVVQWPDAVTPVLVIGHQPTLGQVAARLLAGVEQPWSVKKCGLWWLRSRVRNGERQTVLHGVMAPDLIGR
ncbi:SixA phosphatase family protein [Pseudorhodoferax sp.]|uniref:SixA phosphatase family protein n=1 Tax=Pseudorhodoferax sp. TaxID=1993553 RepID=UPI001B7A4E19|nr:histidine phosphatase family protein [Pseudorhodoferax sp.]MBP8146302.1 histidine phosphatase family protein [Inhella sp.]